jgi:hypothetical protein
MKAVYKLAIVGMFAWAAGAQAQATRTWVSGVGDDANPCSRTAPCKTFAGAISKTAAGGEINVLDPGGFGAVTITKSITISSEGFEAGILAAGTNGVVVNAGPNDFIVLRGLDFEGIGTGLNGINFLAGGALFVENCTINNFSQKGINFTPSGVAQLNVTNTIIRNQTAAASGGIVIAPGVAGTANALIDHVTIERGLSGVTVTDRSKVLIRRSAIGGVSGNGVLASAATTQAAVVIEDSTISGGTGTGATVGAVRADSLQSLVTLSNVTIANNASNGVIETNSGSIQTFSNNRIVGNTPNIGAGTVMAVLAQQ